MNIAAVMSCWANGGATTTVNVMSFFGIEKGAMNLELGFWRLSRCSD